MSFTEAKSLPDFDKFWDYKNPRETENKFRSLLGEIKLNDSDDYVLQLRTQIARAQGLQKKYEDALKTLDQVQKHLSPKSVKAEIRYFLERGRVINTSMKSAEALPLFIKSYELSIQRKFDNFAVDAAHMAAIAEPENSKKMEWNLKALAIAENSKDFEARQWLGSLYNNIGWTYHDSVQFESALNMFAKAFEFRKTKNDSSSVRIAKWSMARTLRSLKRYSDAFTFQLELEKEFQSIGEKDGYVFEELGELYLATSRPLEAKKYFALAYEELSKDEWLMKSEKMRMDRLRELSGK